MQLLFLLLLRQLTNRERRNINKFNTTYLDSEQIHAFTHR